MAVITVKVSDSERTLKEKHLVYEDQISVYKQDPVLCEFVKQAIENFRGEEEDVTVIINISW